VDAHDSLLQDIAHKTSNKAHNDFFISVQYYNLSYKLFFIREEPRKEKVLVIILV